MLTQEQTIKFVFDNIHYCPSKRKREKQGYYKSGNYGSYYTTIDKSFLRLQYFASVMLSGMAIILSGDFSEVGKLCIQFTSGLTCLLSVIGWVLTLGSFNAKKYLINTSLASFCWCVAMILMGWMIAVRANASPLLNIPFIALPTIGVFLFRDLFLHRAGVEFSKSKLILRIVIYSLSFIAALGITAYSFADAGNEDARRIRCTLISMIVSTASSFYLSDLFKLYHLIRLERSGVDVKSLDPILNEGMNQAQR